MYKIPFFLVRAVREGRFFYLLLVLLAYLLITPFLQEFLGFQFLYNIFIVINLLASIYAISSNKTQTIIAVSLALPMMILTWTANLIPSVILDFFVYLFTLLFLGVIIISILEFIFTTDKVTHHVIFGAISVYLLIGIAWSILYLVLESFYPGSFSNIPAPDAQPPSSFVYFSFVTITTLGYGDISPLTSRAKALAIGEALVGQIYMTVLVAWLVGMYVSHKARPNSNHDH